MNIFFNLPTPVGNGVGPAVDVSAAGAVKTIVVGGTTASTINVEYNNALLPTDGTWQSALTVQSTGQATVRIACRWMRTRVSDFDPHVGGTTSVDVGTTDEGTSFVSLPVPAGTGAGAPVDVSLILGLFKTVQVGNAFRGTLIVEVSEDGIDWAQPFSFQTPGGQSAVIAAHFMRVRRRGVPPINPGTPLVNVGFATAASGDEGVAISAAGSSQATGTVVFADSNGVTFGMSGSVVTASVGTDAGVAVSAGTSVQASGTISFGDSNGISFGLSNSTLTASYTQSTGLAVGAGSETAVTGTVVFADSNGIAFGMSDSSQITASYSQSTAPDAIAAGTQTATSGTVRFANSNGITFGLSGSVLTASVQTVGGTATGVGISAGTQVATTGAVVFANSNGVTFGLNAQTLTASYSQSTAPDAIAAGTQTATSGTVLFSNSNGVSFGLSGSVLTGSVAPDQGVGISAGTSSQATGTVVFSNSNGVSFGLNAQTLTAAFSQSTGPDAIAAGTQTATSGTVVFADSNGITFGLSGSVLTGSVLPDQGVGISAGTSSQATGTVVFSNSNGVSFGLNAQTLTAAFSQSTGPDAIAAGTQTATSGTVLFSNSNGVSFGLSGSVLTASVAPDQGVGISAGTQTATSGTVVFSNSNGVSFGLNAQTLTASFSQSTAPSAIAAGSQTATSGTVVFSNSNGVSFGLNAQTLTASYSQSTAPGAIAAGTQTATSGTVLFSNSNGVSFGLSGSVLTASVGGGGVGVAAGTQTAVTGTVSFVDSNGIVFGMSGSSQITASYSQSSDVMSRALFNDLYASIAMSSFVSTMMIQTVSFPGYLSATQAMQQISISQNSNSTGAVCVSLGFYTFSRSTANLASSGSRLISWTSGSGSTGNQYGGVSAGQWRTIPITVNLTPGNYLIVEHYMLANATSVSVGGKSYALPPAGDTDGAAASQWIDGFSGSTFSSAMPSSIVVTEAGYVRTGGTAARHPGFLLQGTF